MNKFKFLVSNISNMIFICDKILRRQSLFFYNIDYKKCYISYDSDYCYYIIIIIVSIIIF